MRHKFRASLAVAFVCTGLATSAIGQNAKEVRVEDVFMSTLEVVPNRQVMKALGLECRTTDWNGGGRVGEVVGRLIRELRKDAADAGGNAIVNVRVAYGTFAQHKVTEGPGNVTYIDREAPILAAITVCGDAMLLK